jgi:hypothetical protein
VAIVQAMGLISHEPRSTTLNSQALICRAFNCHRRQTIDASAHCRQKLSAGYGGGLRDQADVTPLSFSALTICAKHTQALSLLKRSRPTGFLNQISFFPLCFGRAS